MLVVRETVMAGAVTIGGDKICGYAPIPQDGKLISVEGEVHVFLDEETPVKQVRGYGISAEMVPVVDPDDVTALDSMWDNMVTKQSDAVVAAATVGVDFDYDTLDTAPDVEPGEVDLNRMTGLLNPTKRIFEPHMEWMSFAKGPGRGFLRVDSADDHYIPTSYKTFRSRRRLVAEKMPHYALIALSAPSMDDEETSHSSITAAGNWGILGNLDNVMDDFWRINAGLVEAGAESPYAEISAQIEDLVAPPIHQPATGVIGPATSLTFMVACKWVMDFPEESFTGPLKAN